MEKKYGVKDFVPLIVIFLLIFLLTSIKQVYNGLNYMHFMRDFMGFFFIIFSLFKIIHLKGFAQAYSEYDIVAKRSIFYAYAYPFIECGLGISYLLQWNLFWISVITAVLMFVSSIGVFQALMKKEAIPCACLGVVFNIPMTYVTLLEDFLMLAMALLMIFMEY